MNKFNHNQIGKVQKKFSSQQLNYIRLSFSYRVRIQEVLSKFIYQTKITYRQNVKKFCQSLSNILELQQSLKYLFIHSFSQYISHQENIPIEINFKKLRYEQLISLVQQWENSIKQPSLLRPSERLYSIQHRNILFSRVFVQQKQNIEEYFQALSEKKMLKGVDIYQLLVDILSHYFLYEFNTDNETFFEKVNSFNNFLEVVQQFINSEKRIIIDNKSKDFQYIKLYQFEALVYFWQTINPELELRSDKRFSINSIQVQTQRHQIMSSIDKQTQTIQTKQKIQNLQQIINGTLKNLNKLTQIEDDPQKLQMIQNVCQALRKQKIKLTQYQKCKNTRKKAQSPRQLLQINRQFRFLDANSQQSDIQLQKTERIKGYTSPDQIKQSRSKRKQKKQESDEKSIESRRVGSINIKLPNLQSKLKKTQIIKNQQTPSFQSENILQHQVSSCSQTKPINLHPHYTPTKIQNIQSKPMDFILPQNLDLQTQPQPSRASQNYNVRKYERKSEQRSTLGLLQLVYNHYKNKSTSIMDIKKLNQFFVDIGIISEVESIFDLKAIKAGKIKDINKIKEIQFLDIMGLIMKDDPDLTYEVISEFIDVYVKPKETKSLKPEVKNYQKLVNSYQIKSQIKMNESSQNISKLLSEQSDHKNNSLINYQTPYYRNSIPYYGDTSFSKEKSPENKSRRKRYMYCQQTPKNKNDSYSSKFSTFGTNYKR